VPLTNTFGGSFYRLTHDIGLDEFEDEDLSEITEMTDEFEFRARRHNSDIKVRTGLA